MTRLGLLGLVLAGCALPQGLTPSPYTVVNGDPHRDAVVPEVGQAEWTLARARLAQLRSEVPRRPYVERVQIGVVDPRTGKVYRARGAMAVSPERAARLVLLGPGGTTALDVWVTPDRYRVAIPSIKLEQRGGRDLSGARGLPVGLLRWWFLGPLDGELVFARSTPSEATFILRKEAATVTLRTDGDHFVAMRREHGIVEGLDWSGHGLVPTAGARGRYIEGEWGLRVHVIVEELLPDEPDAAAFLDPDASEGTKL